MNMARTIGTIGSNGYVRLEKPDAEDAKRLAEILSTRTFPGTNTDRELFADYGTLADQFEGEEQVLEKVISESRKRGYNPNPNDLYMPRLAECVGDPLAFVPATGGRSHIKKVAKLRDHDCMDMSGKVINRRSRYRDPEFGAE